MRFTHKLFVYPAVLAFFLLLAGFTPKTWQGDNILARIIAKFNLFQESVPQEKVYLHLDKPYYAAGDDIWFKAYLVSGSNNTPSSISKVLYVELLNQEDSIYSRIAVHIDNGLGHGDFALQDSIPEGNYRLRAYTSWMQNFVQDYFFHQDLRIWNPRLSAVMASADFKFKPSAEGDSVLATVSFRNQKSEALPPTGITYSTKIKQKQSATRKTTTNTQGEALLRFFLPKENQQEKAHLQVTLQQDGKKLSQHTFTVPGASQKLDVKFMPEGGHMVANMWNVLGFKVVNALGEGQEAKGAIYDQTGRKVTDFSTHTFGMGRFGFVPQKDMQYQARLSTKEGQETAYPLPVAQEKGAVLALDNSKPDNIKVKIYLVGYQDGESRPKSLSLVGQTNGRIYFTGHVAQAKDLVAVDIPRANFPTGVAQLTLFSDTGAPLAERLFFVNHKQNLQLSLTTDKETYRPREKVTMQLQARDHLGQPVSGQFSVAVTDASQVEQVQHGSSILTNLLLTSDLRGHIEQPGYYFSSQSPEVLLALDNLMLTQGWRRFVWQDILQDKLPQLNHPIEKGLAITGTVLKLNKKPEANALLTVFGLGKSTFFHLDSADNKGAFAIPVNGMPDSTQIMVQGRTKKGGNSLMVDLDTGVPIAPVTPDYARLTPDYRMTSQIKAFLQANQDQFRLDKLTGKSILMNSVLIKGKKQEEERRANEFHTYSDASIDPNALNKEINFFSAVSGRSGLRVKHDDFGRAFLLMRVNGAEYTPTLMIDGMEVEAFSLQAIRVEAVSKIEILHPESAARAYGLKGNNGIVAVTLKPGGLGIPNIFRGIALYKGYRLQTARQFYMPLYDTPQKEEKPDLRTTIFWSPSIQTDTNGQAEFTFYAADAPTSYNAIIEGLTISGQLGRGTAKLQVQANATGKPAPAGNR